MNKFIIYKADSTKWKPVLANVIDPDQYPEFLGGEQRDPDGDPRYTTKVSRARKLQPADSTKRQRKYIRIIESNENCGNAV